MMRTGGWLFFWCAWYSASKERENIKKVSERATVTETQKICTDATICTDAQEGVQCKNRMTDFE